MYYISQIGKYDCGIACLKMMFAIINKDKNYLYEPIQSDKNGGTSYSQLIDIAVKHNVKIEAFKLKDFDELKKEKRFPIIVTFKENKHAVLVRGIFLNLVYVYDPSIGKYFIPFNEFIKNWDGTFLEILSFQKTKSTFKSNEPIKKFERIFLSFIQITGIASALTAIYFLDKQFPRYYGILFTAIFIALQAFAIIYSFHLVNDINKQYRNLMRKIKSDNFYDFYKNFELLKAKSIAFPSNFISSIAIAVVVMIILLINGSLNYIYVIAALVIALFRFIFVNPLLKKKDVSVAELENKINHVKDSDTYISIVDDCHNAGKKYSRITMAIKMVELILFLLIPVIMLNVNGGYDFTYVLLYLCMEICLSKAFLDLLNVTKENNEYKCLLAKHELLTKDIGEK